MKTFNFIDSNEVGLLSWSLGGTAIVKTAMITQDIKLSYDGTEIHYFGFDTAWRCTIQTDHEDSAIQAGTITALYVPWQ
jgi:hypothetical protein